MGYPINELERKSWIKLFRRAYPGMSLYMGDAEIVDKYPKPENVGKILMRIIQRRINKERRAIKKANSPFHTNRSVKVGL